MRKCRLTGTNILLERKEAETKTRGGLFIPTDSQEVPLQGTIVMIGPDVKICEVGREILFDRFAGVPIVIDGNQYLVLDEADIILIFE